MNNHPDTYPVTVSVDGEEHYFDNNEKLYSTKKDAKKDVEVAAIGEGSLDVVLHSEREIATHVISIDDDPSLNPWTFRAFFIGLGLSAFGGSLAEIYYFKPQSIAISLMFLAIVSYVLGFAMEAFIPRHGPFRFLNPHPFNKKENAFIIVMTSAAANASLATEVLAVQRLYYNITPNAAISIFLLFSSQLIGYGIGGVLRSTLVYPSKMLYPSVLPLMSMLQAFFHDSVDARRRLKVFYIVFGVIFIWELFPEWIFPLLTGISAFCLAAPNSATVSRVFGGSNGNEGLGLLSICLDWQYISDAFNPMSIPLRTQFSALIGIILCTVVFVPIYYNNIWKSQNFPFLSQLLFYENGTQYNQSLILNSNYQVDPTRLAGQGLPYFSGTWVVYLLSLNVALAATFTHLLLWNRDDLRLAWSWMVPANLHKRWQEFRWKGINWQLWKDDGMRDQSNSDEDIDPHYAQMLKLVLRYLCGILCGGLGGNLQKQFHAAVVGLPHIGAPGEYILFFGALFAITGWNPSIQTLAQMIAGYLYPGKPMANMYFVLSSYNTASQATLLLRDLKVGQYAKLPPRATFTAQIIGTLLGAILNYVLMNSIIDSQFDILLSVEGTNIWSGQQPQQYNSQAITWGGLSHQLFSSGMRYEWVPWSYLIGLVAPVPFWLVHRYWPKLRADYLYTPIICGFIGSLAGGINSSVTSFLVVAFLSQWWIRTRYPRWFMRYNYLVAVALDGGAQVMVFILSFAVQGAAGKAHIFPHWWGANQAGNYDRCLHLEFTG